MLHCDDDDLALLALGESSDPQDRDHLAECARCRSRLDQLAATVASVRSITADDAPVTPPSSVWSSIADELGLSDPDTTADVAGATVTELSSARSRRSRVWVVGAVAAAVGVLAGVGITAGVVGSRDAGTGGQVVATAQLDPIEDSGLTGTATVVRDGDAKVLTVSVPGLPAQTDAYYEVWMATPDTSTMVAIGTLNPGETGRFSLPADMDAAAFPVVDVSVEHFDGDAGHSATSIARGTLGI